MTPAESERNEVENVSFTQHEIDQVTNNTAIGHNESKNEWKESTHTVNHTPITRKLKISIYFSRRTFCPGRLPMDILSRGILSMSRTPTKFHF